MKNRYDIITEVQKANPYHDSRGRFTTKNGAGGGGGTAAGSGASAAEMAKKKYGKTMAEMRESVTKIPQANEIANEMLNKQMASGEKTLSLDEITFIAFEQGQKKWMENHDKEFDKLEKMEAEYLAMDKKADELESKLKGYMRTGNEEKEKETREELDKFWKEVGAFENKLWDQRGKIADLNDEAYDIGIIW